MTDESDRPDAAADSGEAPANSDAAGSGQTAVATRPLRPTGKRSRRAGAEEADAELEATESGDSADDAKKPGSGKKADKKAAGPSRNPFVFVYNYLKQVVAELRKVIWPNRKQMVTYTGVVLAFLVFMMALVAGSDFGFAKLVMLVFGS